MNKEKLQKFVLNKLFKRSEEEKVVDWIEASPENEEEFITLKNLYAITGFANYNTYIKEYKRKNIKTKSNSRTLYGLLKYAAIFILAFVIGGGAIFFFNHQSISQLAYNEIIVPAGESAELILNDHTHVWLNSGSKLVYPSIFTRKNREVRLTGEAFFEVTHNDKKPFNVVTPQLTIEVVGTSFNVEALENMNVVDVTLVEGKVNLKSKKGKLLTVLKPGENANFDLIQKNITITSVETSYFTSWKDGYLVLQNEKLVDIATKLEQWFNVVVIFNDDSIKDIMFTGTILKNKPITQILDILKYTSKIDYSVEIKNEKQNIIHLKKAL